MILQRYQDFRMAFADVGAATANDGFKEWPVGRVRASGFSSSLSIPVIQSFPITITCNAQASDAVAGVDEYDWYLSQRTDTPAIQYLSLAAVANKSGTVTLDVTGQVANLLPGVNSSDYVSDHNLALICKHAAIYVQRRSDKAIQWAYVYAGS